MKRIFFLWIALLLASLLVLSGCDLIGTEDYYYGDDYDAASEGSAPSTQGTVGTSKGTEAAAPSDSKPLETESKTDRESERDSDTEPPAYTDTQEVLAPIYVNGEKIPEYSGKAYVSLNGGVPTFSSDELVTNSYEYYSPLDSLGRCGMTVACVGTDLMPTEDRGSISSVKPSGWINKEYDTTLVSGGYLYNRSHLIGFQLTGENANERNLITGTRYFNVEGMLPFENMVADYLKEEPDAHVMYRVTPIYYENDLVARGVHMEAFSVEDDGEAISFNVFVYNVQPGIIIKYATGESYLSGELPPAETETETEAYTDGSGKTVTYILNKSSKKFHLPTCSSASSISEKNKELYYGDRQSLMADGYTACGFCKP